MNESRSPKRSKIRRLRPLLFFVPILVAGALWNSSQRASFPGALARDREASAEAARLPPDLVQPGSAVSRSESAPDPRLEPARVAAKDVSAQETEFGELRGFAHSSLGERLLGHRIWVEGEDAQGELSKVSTRSDRTGAFVVEGLLPGTYTVHLLAKARIFPSSVRTRQTVQITASESTFIDLYMAERRLTAEIEFLDHEEDNDTYGGVDRREISLTPHQSEVHPTVRATLELMSAKKLRARIDEIESDEEMVQMPEQFSELRRELAELRAAFASTEDWLRPLQLKGLGAGAYTLRIELGFIELPNGETEPIAHEQFVDLTESDVTGLSVKISQIALIEEALTRASTR